MAVTLILGILTAIVSAISGNSQCIDTHNLPLVQLHSDIRNQISLAAALPDLPNPPPLEIHPLIVSGPSKNRVDLVFFSDGCPNCSLYSFLFVDPGCVDVLEEKDKFIQDALRLAKDVSGNQTFNTVKPLMNFWAAFTVSEESGVGIGGKPKKTPYGLYRDGTELRAVYYAYPDVADAACTSMGVQCDFPILLGNDPLYGGLGGQFTVITSSVLNGPQILRHELGHSIIPVGEEYDGGFAYFGVNAYHNLSQSVPWEHWLTLKDSEDDFDDREKEIKKKKNRHNHGHGHPRVERSVMPFQIYPWTLLNTSSPHTSTFVSSGTFPRYLVRFSLSGLPEASDLRVELDGEDLGWKPKVGLGVDRWHYDIKLGNGWQARDEAGAGIGTREDRGLSGGEHQLSFVLLDKDREGEAQLCSAEILEFGSEDEFVSEPGYHGVFPTYSDKNETSYRPTNEDCLMRIVTTPNFCSVCLEGLWHALLSRVRLIDNLVVLHEKNVDTVAPTKMAPKARTVIEVKPIPLAQFRSSESIFELDSTASNLSGVQALAESESYTIIWSRNGVELDEFENRTRIEVEESDLGMEGPSVYAVDVQFRTPEVRVDKKGYLKDRREIKVWGLN
ncbi:hypothetical protein D9757_007158 [Collybiopsis confluens]|uniref:IgA peptidase M64-domain-containing protein n=1 Tax=Collybiopsis confluens TaxID=2823264 RepID=A0A8H5HC16_9AGAR|nr:hypothetical protein D9757_007158 [Collybiopsis confluens]